MHRFASLLFTIVAMVLCGVAGGLAGFATRAALGLDGVAGALCAVAIAMPVAFAAWVAGYALLRTLHLLR